MSNQPWNTYGSVVGNDVLFTFDADNSLLIENGMNFGTINDDLVLI